MINFCLLQITEGHKTVLWIGSSTIFQSIQRSLVNIVTLYKSNTWDSVIFKQTTSLCSLGLTATLLHRAAGHKPGAFFWHYQGLYTFYEVIRQVLWAGYQTASYHLQLRLNDVRKYKQLQKVWFEPEHKLHPFVCLLFHSLFFMFSVQSIRSNSI